MKVSLPQATGRIRLMDIALDKVCELILRAKAIDVKEGVTDPDSGSNPIDDFLGFAPADAGFVRQFENMLDAGVAASGDIQRMFPAMAHGKRHVIGGRRQPLQRKSPVVRDIAGGPALKGREARHGL